MGKIIYGDPAIEIVFDDRVLAHLQIVIGAKLRRKESFFLSWRDETAGEGHNSIWLNDAIPLYFKYFGSKTPIINRAWVSQLMESSNSPAGLRLLPEPDPGSAPEHPHAGF